MSTLATVTVFAVFATASTTTNPEVTHADPLFLSTVSTALPPLRLQWA
ncbi:hypothetical protein [Streptosporangium vulgare]